MQAIIKSKHQLFCSWLQDIRNKQSIADEKINELEKELLDCYDRYQQKRYELREITNEYEEKQKSIRNRVKNYKYKDFSKAFLLPNSSIQGSEI